jgi:hypothetical protein
MRRVLHPNLKRGHVAERAAVILLMALLMALVAAVFQGVRMLKA